MWVFSSQHALSHGLTSWEDGLPCSFTSTDLKSTSSHKIPSRSFGKGPLKRGEASEVSEVWKIENQTLCGCTQGWCNSLWNSHSIFVTWKKYKAFVEFLNICHRTTNHFRWGGGRTEKDWDFVLSSAFHVCRPSWPPKMKPDQNMQAVKRSCYPVPVTQPVCNAGRGHRRHHPPASQQNDQPKTKVSADLLWESSMVYQRRSPPGVGSNLLPIIAC